MNSPGFKIICLFATLLGSVPIAALAADEGTVVSLNKRQEVLDKAKKFLVLRDPSPVTVDPFHSERFAEMVASLNRIPGAAVPQGPVVVSTRTERQVLQAIATSLKPTGNFIVSGEHTLVFGQKRVKAGGFLTITFEGTEYTLEITAIERTSFTLRLNREEFTRPIK